MEYEITRWNGKKDFKLQIRQSLEEYLEVGDKYTQELKLNLKEQIENGNDM